MSMLKHWSKPSREAVKSQPLEILLKFWLKKKCDSATQGPEQPALTLQLPLQGFAPDDIQRRLPA